MQLMNDEGKSLGCLAVSAKSTGALSSERVEILKLLSKASAHPAELARKLDLPVQTIYYHIRMLERAGFIRFEDYAEVNGGVAKKYSCASDSFAVVVNERGWKEAAQATARIPRHLEPFVRNGFFDGLLVLGAPDPHGKYRARASDLSILELTMGLGRFAAFDFPLYVLDTQLRPGDKAKNLIVAGGPKVNTLVAELNERLPIRFDANNFEVYSILSKKKYGENVGVIELIDNPFGLGKAGRTKALVISGLNQNGTKAAVMAMVKEADQLAEGNRFKPKVFAKVIEGFDEDGDGIVDAVEVLE